MSKYLCQNCKSNNNGWCAIRKRNGLKKLNITSCNTFEDANNVKSTNESTTKIKQEDKHCSNPTDKIQGNRVLGKREMLCNIQMQVFAINKDDGLTYEEKYKALIKSIKSIGIHLNFEEELWNVNSIVDSVIDEDMIKASKLFTERI